MGFKPESDVSSYIEMLTPQDLKEAFEEYGFEVELKKDDESNEKTKEGNVVKEYETLNK